MTPAPHGPMTAPGQATTQNQMTERARFTWSQGDFARAGAEQVIVGELLCRAIDIHPANASSTSPRAPATPPWPLPGGEPR